MNDEALRKKIRKEIQSLKDGLDTNAVNTAKIAWCEETKDNIMHLISEDRERVEREARRDELKGIVALHRDLGDDIPYSLGAGPYIKGRLIKLKQKDV
jgi:hypothetical protein